MARISGIQIEKDTKGNPKYVRFDLSKHPDILNILNSKGAIDSDFEREWKRGITGTKLRKEMHKHIDNLFANGH